MWVGGQGCWQLCAGLGEQGLQQGGYGEGSLWGRKGTGGQCWRQASPKLLVLRLVAKGMWLCSSRLGDIVRGQGICCGRASVTLSLFRTIRFCRDSGFYLAASWEELFSIPPPWWAGSLALLLELESLKKAEPSIHATTQWTRFLPAKTFLDFSGIFS